MAGLSGLINSDNLTMLIDGSVCVPWVPLLLLSFPPTGPLAQIVSCSSGADRGQHMLGDGQADIVMQAVTTLPQHDDELVPLGCAGFE